MFRHRGGRGSGWSRSPGSGRDLDSWRGQRTASRGMRAGDTGSGVCRSLTLLVCFAWGASNTYARHQSSITMTGLRESQSLEASEETAWTGPRGHAMGKQSIFFVS